MISETSTYRLTFSNSNEEKLKGLFIAVVHATRIPPHIGIIANEKYHSLSVKGQNINTPVNSLIKTSVVRKIPTLFIRIKPHPTFSEVYLGEHFITNVQQFKRVDAGVATCLTPIRSFFEEVYYLSMKDVNYLYELLPALDSKGLIESITSLNIDEKNYQLPFYTNNEINAGIEQVRKEYKSQ